MASPIYNFHFLLALLAMASSAFIHPALSDGSTQQLIDKICQSVEEYAFCSKTFNQLHQGLYMLDSERRSPRAQENCITIFSTPPTPPNPVADRNRQMRILIAMTIVTGMELTSKLS
ncbi:uncharacterized protein LOC108471700 [Gossypium arboreum]|uniref:uncharacterized protein LOC108471700 n=1 Tax=Gossypium arboreum TaxID=29729 RepID=UPI0008196659|nr:uncharacterized protein LOC108471700 [Gossypium arboreum]